MVAKSLTMITDSQGTATAQGLRLNQVAGKMPIHVNASYRGLTARTSITQFSVLPPGAKASSSSGGGHGGLIAVLVVLGAAAAGGGAYLATHKSTSSALSESLLPPLSPSVSRRARVRSSEATNPCAFFKLHSWFPPLSSTTVLSAQIGPLSIVNNLPYGCGREVVRPGLRHGRNTALYVWSVTGQIPPGLAVNSVGVISGTPTIGGTYNFTLTVVDARQTSVSRALVDHHHRPRRPLL